MNRRQCSAEACDGEVLFARNVRTGRWMVLDAEPNPSGNVLLEIDGKARMLTRAERAQIDERDPMQIGNVYMPHHATCKDVQAFRGERRRHGQRRR